MRTQYAGRRGKGRNWRGRRPNVRRRSARSPSSSDDPAAARQQHPASRPQLPEPFATMLALAGKLAGPARRSATIAWVSGARLGSSFSSTSPARAQEAADAEGGGERPAAAARTSTPAVEFRRADLHSKWGGAASRLPQGEACSSTACCRLADELPGLTLRRLYSFSGAASSSSSSADLSSGPGARSSCSCSSRVGSRG